MTEQTEDMVSLPEEDLDDDFWQFLSEGFPSTEDMVSLPEEDLNDDFWQFLSEGFPSTEDMVSLPEEDLDDDFWQFLSERFPSTEPTVHDASRDQAEVSQTSQQRWRERMKNDLEYRERARKYQREYNRDRYKNEPDYRERLLEHKRERYKNESDYRERARKYQREYNRERYKNDPEYRERRLQYERESGANWKLQEKWLDVATKIHELTEQVETTEQTIFDQRPAWNDRLEHSSKHLMDTMQTTFYHPNDSLEERLARQRLEQSREQRLKDLKTHLAEEP
ncbi:hypothetical protein [Dictyobacter arantiisoli]|uniref:hypothetical protein n=1 Tax=Dictyobacter arantiisoli TaxID=2014874 RepID=UPI0011F01583|nr:hypothetical protein [Dictyobacter arantiisoli]